VKNGFCTYQIIVNLIRAALCAAHELVPQRAESAMHAPGPVPVASRIDARIAAASDGEAPVTDVLR